VPVARRPRVPGMERSLLTVALGLAWFVRSNHYFWALDAASMAFLLSSNLCISLWMSGVFPVS
jgi:hypothetical protein